MELYTAEFEKQCFDVLRRVRASSVITLAPHKNPDGDAVGSILGFAQALKDNEQKNAVVYSADPVSPHFDFLSGYSDIVHAIAWYPDLFIGFDYGDFGRLGVEENVLLGSQIACFDHHPLRNQAGDVCIITTQVASTTELLYHFMKVVGWYVSPQTAQCLLTGIITDTGGFAHNIHSHTFTACAELVEQGADISTIHEKITNGKQQEVLNIWGSLVLRAEKNKQYGFLSIFVSYEQFQEYEVSVDDISGVVGLLNRVFECSFSLLVVEYEPEKIKGSLRGDRFKGVEVAPVAQKLGGGGHTYAAGFSLLMPFEQAQQRIMDAVHATVPHQQ